MFLKSIVVYADPQNEVHKKSVAYLKTVAHEVEEKDFVHDPITETRLDDLCMKLGITPAELIDKESDYVKQKYGHSAYSDLDWLQIIKHDHRVIKLPIVVSGQKAVILKEPSDALRLAEQQSL